jgi:uncharacterized protein YkwD
MSFNTRLPRVLTLGFMLSLALYAVSAQEQADAIAAADYLSPLEKEVLREINLARTQPTKYAEALEAMKAYYDGKLFKRPNEETVLTEEGIPAVEEAVRFLRKVKPAPALAPSRGLSLAARDHVAEQGSRGALGHRSRDGSTISDRLNRYGRWQTAIAENISYGESQARMIVAVWIIDDGVPGRGHRDNLFSAKFRVAGVSCGKHVAFKSMCVVDFAASYQEKN